MKLDKHVVDMFTELTKPADDVKMEKTCYGTISVVDGTGYVKLDGSDLLVPAASTVKTSHGDRVTVLMKNHSLTVTGNLTAPATDGEGGSSGEAGTAATIEVGTVTTGEAGSSASVTNSGTTSAAVFDFVIPKGDKGEKGDAGTWDGTIPDHEHTVSDITDFPTSLPANGGNADTLDGLHAGDFSQIINLGNTSTDTKTAIGIKYKTTTYWCSNWTDYPVGLYDGQGMIIAAHHNSYGTATGVDKIWCRQIFITPHNSTIYQRLISATTVGEWIGISDLGYHFADRTQIVSGDLNTITTQGQFVVTNATATDTLANQPWTTSGYYLDVYRRSANVITQIALRWDGKISLRYLSGTTWSNWANIADGGNAASVGAYTETKLAELEARIAALERGAT